MSSDLSNQPLNAREDHLVKVISSDQFLKMQGLGNEVPFFICVFRPEETVAMESTRHSLMRRLKQCNVKIQEINIYDLCVEILQREGLWDQILGGEPTWPKSELKELLQNVLDPATHLTQRIAELTAGSEYDVLFLCGVGEVYPYIRSHNVLNNLQTRIPRKPVVLFFPGGYTHSPESGTSLNLFCQSADDKYYRAFNIFDIEP